jgi:hypothetical protein
MARRFFCKEVLGIVESGLDRFIGQMENLTQGLSSVVVSIVSDISSEVSVVAYTLNPLGSSNLF